ncbi:MAG: NTP transferase domain-containing protein [Candidatus Brocadiaceae bacterium]|nr:NTP transferase domain-containing protein [Candidatus Brocadiaceae bacterium]
MIIKNSKTAKERATEGESKKGLKAVILAAGKSTRTYPLTLTRPKPLLKILNKTLLERNLDQLKGIVDEVILVVGYRKEMLMEFIGKTYKDLAITFVEQKTQLGTGDALECVKEHLDGKFIFMCGDDLYSRKDIENCLQHKYALLGKKVNDPERFGVLVTKEGKLTEIVEKPKEFVSDIANTGLYVLDKNVFCFNPEKSDRGEYEATDYITNLAKKEDVFVEETGDFWIPIGYPWNLIEANAFFLKDIKTDIRGNVEDYVTIKGNVVIGKNTIIKSGTYIEGPVMIGENCIIGPGAYIRPDTTIGNNCTIRAEVFDAIIMDGTVAKHYSYIAHSVLCEDVNVAAGTITSDYRHDGKNIITMVNEKRVDSGRRKLGSFIGDHVRTGINTCIYPGRKIWPDKSTLPGEVVKKDVK